MTSATDKLIADNLWRDISEAPRDGTEVDLWCDNAEFPHIHDACSWRRPSESEYWCNGSNEPDDEEGTISSDARWFHPLGYAVVRPTHFRLHQVAPDDRCANALKIAVEALRSIAESSYDYMTGKHSDETAEEALAKIEREAKKGD